MPGRDGTGPMGRGSMTGRGLGLCGGANADRFGAGFGQGLGLGCRGSRGRGFGRGLGRNLTVDQAEAKTYKELLREQKDLLQSRIKLIDEQLGNM